MQLKEVYRLAVSRKEIIEDPLQYTVLSSLQRLRDDLVSNSSTWFGFKKKKQISGIYLYGSIGAGKTFLLDLFFQNVAELPKLRFHFHHFMQQVHLHLQQLQGQQDPLLTVAANISKAARVLFLDEFLVNDITDAMILFKLLAALLTHNVVLVFSSNTPPDNLYLHGLQRASFLPAIELIKSNCEILTLNNSQDYRLGRTALQQSYLFPADELSELALTQQFLTISSSFIDNVDLVIQNRRIHCLKCSEHAAWFEFKTLCSLPRSQLDYLELAERFHTIFISNIPILQLTDTVVLVLLTNLIDVLYDNGVMLVISAEAPLEELCRNVATHVSFQRTMSRLQEMQSNDYLHRHRTRILGTS
ncbi:MAG: cell division protein ZapE [Legionella sp.]